MLVNRQNFAGHLVWCRDLPRRHDGGRRLVCCGQPRRGRVAGGKELARLGLRQCRRSDHLVRVFCSGRAKLGSRVWRIGRTKTWMRAHIWLGLLAVPLIGVHAWRELGGALSATMVVLFAIVIASGIFGLVLQQFLPRMLLERSACRNDRVASRPRGGAILRRSRGIGRGGLRRIGNIRIGTFRCGGRPAACSGRSGRRPRGAGQFRHGRRTAQRRRGPRARLADADGDCNRPRFGRLGSLVRCDDPALFACRPPCGFVAGQADCGGTFFLGPADQAPGGRPRGRRPDREACAISGGNSTCNCGSSDGCMAGSGSICRCRSRWS